MAYGKAGHYGPEALLSKVAAGLVQDSLLPVNVYLPGTTTLASLWTSAAKTTAAANPVSTDANGNLAFYADPGYYDLNFTPVGGGATTISNVLVPVDPADPTPGALGSGTYAALSGNNTLSGTQTISAGFLLLDRHTEGAGVAPELHYVGPRSGWISGIDVANAPLGRDFVPVGQINSYTLSDAATTNASPTLTSASDGQFIVADTPNGVVQSPSNGTPISGPGIPNGTTVAGVTNATTLTMSANATASATGVAVTIGSGSIGDLVYVKHRGASNPTIGLGVTPPDGTYRVQIAQPDQEPAMGTLALRVGPHQTGKALSVRDSTATDRVWINKDFQLSGNSGGAAGNPLQIIGADAGSGVSNLLSFIDFQKAVSWSWIKNSGGGLRLHYDTANKDLATFDTDGTVYIWNKLSHQGTIVGFYGGTGATRQTITGALSSVTDANAKAVLTSIISALTATNYAASGTT